MICLNSWTELGNPVREASCNKQRLTAKRPHDSGQLPYHKYHTNTFGKYHIKNQNITEWILNLASETVFNSSFKKTISFKDSKSIPTT